VRARAAITVSNSVTIYLSLLVCPHFATIDAIIRTYCLSTDHVVMSTSLNVRRNIDD